MKFPITLSSIKVKCSELKVKQYKEILKSIYGDEPSTLLFADTLLYIFSDLLNLDKDYLQANLTVYDLFLLLLEVRTHSLGNTSSIVIERDSKKMTVNLNLDNIKVDLEKINPLKFETSVSFNDMTINLKPPTLEKILTSLEVEDEYLLIIDNLENQSGIVKINTSEQAKHLFNVLPPKISLQIIDFYRQYIEATASNNFLERYGIVDQKLNFIPTLETVIWFAKLFFNESLSSLYDNIFYLSIKGKMSAEYIEQCNPGEYIYFVKKLEEWLSQQNKQNRDPQGEEVMDGDMYPNNSFE